jgi:uncharacterized membrane protein (TIGR02234 family)
MSSARGLVGSLVGVAVGGALILLASGRVWATATVHVPGAPTSKVSVTGHAVEPALPALGIALLALAVAILAGRGLMRRLVGVTVTVVGGIALGVAIAGRGAVSSALTGHEIGDAGIPVHGSANGWWLLAALGGLLTLLVGLVVTVRSGRWAAMGAKYEPPRLEAQAPTSPDAQGAWDALDRGEDPTQ